MATADVDVGYLATHLHLPTDDLLAATINPTVDLVKGILASVYSKAQEYHTLCSQKVQLEVKLDASLHNVEALRKAGNETTKKALKEVEDVRKQLNEEETSRQGLENELRSLQSSCSVSQSEVGTLRSRVALLETANRDALAAVDAKNMANKALEEQLQEQQQKNQKLNHEITNLHQSVQDANAMASSAKLKEQTLKQQADVAQRSADFWENEAKTKMAETITLRQEKGARISDLQQKLDDQKATIDSLQRTDQQLRQRLSEAQQKSEQGWLKVQALETASARIEKDLRQDLDAANRLVQLKEEQMVNLQGRLSEVDSRLEQMKRDGEHAIKRISVELEHANRQNEDYANEMASLRAETSRLEALVAGAGSPPGGGPAGSPQTPRPSGSVFARSGPSFGTPFFSGRKTLTNTDLVEQLYKLKGALDSERQKNQDLTKNLDDMMDQLEAKGPELEELQSENQRLQLELEQMSHMSDASYRERDAARKAARKAESALATLQAKVNILEKRISDQNAQLQMLIFNLQHRDQELSLEETLQLQRMERGADFMSDDMSDVDSLVMERLVVFKDVQELQQKNQELLGITHELSEQLKREEAAVSEKQVIEHQKEVDGLKQRLADFADRMRSLKSEAESTAKQRDMFRRLVENKASARDLASSLGRDATGVLTSKEQSVPVPEVDEDNIITAMQRLQQDFANYRSETGVDRTTMREQIDRLSTEKSEIQAKLSKVQSQLSLATERNEMIHANFVSLQKENTELQKRSQILSETASKQDLRTQQVAEDLIVARGQLESSRSELANLKAEKNMWKDTQDRMSRDNENLLQEQSRLNTLVATHETLKNERDLSDSEAKRHHQAQIDSLESELRITRRKLEDEANETKMLRERNEFDARQSQKRIDDLGTNLSRVREELVATKTTRDHLQARVDELTIELRSAEEKADRLQPQSTTRSANANRTAADEANERIQDLVYEVTDLRRDLELAKSQLDNATAQANQYKELSQTAEDELNRMTSAQDQYAAEMDALLAAKDAAIQQLEGRVQDLSSELARSNSQLNEVRDSQSEVTHRLEEREAQLKEDIKRLQDQINSHLSTAQASQETVRVQAGIASSAQASYENEVAKHGETVKTLSTIRAEYNELRTTVASLQAQADSAKTTLLQSESSWEDQRQSFKDEIFELGQRWNNVTEQNKLLYQQLENVTAQVTALRNSHSATNESTEAIAAHAHSMSQDSLQAMNNYLRRDKEIVEVQLDIKARDLKRVQEELEYTRSQLEEARLKLEQERRSQVDSERSSTSHKELMAKLEDLNLLRESNTTLRTEARRAQSLLTENASKIGQLEATIQPLESTIEELQSKLTFRESEMKQLHEDRDRWQKRTEDILAKQGRTDPAEVEVLRQAVTTLTEERDALQKRIEQLEDDKRRALTNYANQAKEKAREQNRIIKGLTDEKKRLEDEKAGLNEEINDLTAARDSFQGDLGKANDQLTSTKVELEETVKRFLDVQVQLAAFQRQVLSLQEEASHNQSLAKSAPAPAEDSQYNAALEQEKTALEQQLCETQNQLEATRLQKADVEQELQTVQEQLEVVTLARDQALASVASAATQSGMDNDDAGTETDTGAPSQMQVDGKDLDARIDALAKTRLQGLKDKLNAQFRTRKAQFEEKEAVLTRELEGLRENIESYKLRLEQEQKIREAEQASASQQTSGSASSVPSVGVNEKDIMDWVNGNETAKLIIKKNVSRQVMHREAQMKEECREQHVARAELEQVKAEWEQKVEKARESGIKMGAMKATVQLNISERRARNAAAKLQVVQEAATTTPQRPVVEVWDVAKDVEASTTLSSPAKQAQTGTAATAAPAAAAGLAPRAVPQVPATAFPNQVPTPATLAPAPTSQGSVPSATTATPAPAEAAAPAALAAPATPAKPAAFVATAAPANPFASHLPAPVSTLPPAPNSIRGNRGVNANARGRGTGAAHPGHSRGGRGTLGNKRPRGESETGANKRHRGGGA